MLPYVPILIQALLAGFSALVMTTHVLPAVNQVRHPQIVLDIWVPLFIALPMITIAGKIGHDVGGIGWIPFGAPLTVGMLGLGFALLIKPAASLSSNGSGPAFRDSISRGTLLIWIATGLIFFLLGRAHNLTVWIGQTLFAIAAVVMWVNTPPFEKQSPPSSPAEKKLNMGMTIALICGLGQAGAVWMVDERLLFLSGILMMLHASIILISASRLAGPGAALRLGGWTATYGLLFGLGICSLTFMVPTIFGVFFEAEPTVTVQVAYGFGLYLPEVTGLLLLGPLTWLVSRIGPRTRLICGALVVLGMVVMVAWRLESLWAR